MTSIQRVTQAEVAAGPVIDQKHSAVAADGSFRTAATQRGQMSGIASSQWYARPNDQRFLNLDDLYDATFRFKNECKVADVEVKELEVVGALEDNYDLRIKDRSGKLGNPDDPADDMAPSHYSFGQICGLVGAPAAYLRDLPAALAAMNLQWGLQADRREVVKVLNHRPLGAVPEIRAATGPQYGRIWNYEMVDAFRRINARMQEECGRQLKVPGEIDWSSGDGFSVRYNPFVEPTLQTTTLYASDRDCFIFLVDDTHPIEIGKLPDGSPDLIFRGVVASNSEVGARALKLTTFLLRGVCMNRCIWGGEQFQSISIRHSKFAPEKFANEAVPQIAAFANASVDAVVQGIEAAKSAILAQNDDEVKEWLAARKTPKSTIAELMETSIREEGRPIRSAWDMVQAMTARARTVTYQDERVSIETEAGALLAKAAGRRAAVVVDC
jgi:hypothetical protein